MKRLTSPRRTPNVETFDSTVGWVNAALKHRLMQVLNHGKVPANDLTSEKCAFQSLSQIRHWRFDVVLCLIASSFSLLKSNRDQKEAGCCGRGRLYVRTRLVAATRVSRPERNNVLGACAKEAKPKRASPTRERSCSDS